MKRAVLFLNLGGPETLADVRPFLYRLFVDPEIIRIRWTPLRKIVAWLISTSRAKSSSELYKKIGGGSPIRRLTEDQSRETERSLRANGHDVVVRTAFSCSEPLIEDVVADLHKQGVRSFLSFPLYPQYSLTTTKGALARVREAVNKWAPGSKIEEICSFPDHPLFIRAHVDLIQKEVSRFSKKEVSPIHLLFSAHSIPEKLVTRLGDPYQDQVNKTVRAVLDAASWSGPSSLAWQSKLGPVRWLGPATKDVLADLGAAGVKRVLIVPIAFVTDHIETLEEIDVQLKEIAYASGIEEFYRTPGLNSHPDFIEALVDISQSQTVFWNE